MATTLMCMQACTLTFPTALGTFESLKCCYNRYCFSFIFNTKLSQQADILDCVKEP